MLSDLVLDTQFAFLRLPDYFRLKKTSFIRIFCQLQIETPVYEVKIADHSEELLQVLKLRFDVFYREFAGRKVRFPFIPYDVDHFDFWCDHLIVKEKRSGKVVAAYRLLHSGIKKETYYSETEFDLNNLLNLTGSKLELGRACVHRDFRHGTVMSLLWKGLLKYARLTETKYLFGCSSIPRKDFSSFAAMKDSLRKRNAFLPSGSVTPKSDYQINNHPRIQKELQDSSGASSMGSLMHMYVMAGAQLSEEGAYDQEMDCLDLFTWIDLENLPESFERRFSC